MAKKRSIWYSIFGFQCPRCRQGNLYKGSIFEGIYNMHDQCPSCNQNFQLEPGFYWGAMYIGYGLSSAYMLTTMLVLMFGFQWSLGQCFGAAIAGGVVIVPLVARLARSIWIHIYVRYRPKIAEQVEES